MKYLSQALSRNTTLTFLNLRSKHKIKDQQKQFINNQLVFHLYQKQQATKLEMLVQNHLVSH